MLDFLTARGRVSAGRRVTAIRTLTALATLLLSPLSAAGQAAGEGMINLPNIPKSTARAVAFPDKASGPVAMDPLCVVDRELLGTTCVPGEGLACGPAGETIPCQELDGGVAFVAAGVGLRNTGFGAFNLRGAPPGADLVVAFLFWGAIREPQGNAASSTAVFNGAAVTGSLLGATDEPCWNVPDADAAAYVADVTALLDPEINGVYPLEVDGSSSINGQSPFAEPAPSGNRLEGALVLAIYQHEEITGDARVYVHAGTVPVITSIDVDHTLEPPLPPLTDVVHLRAGGDGQRFRTESPGKPYRTWIGPGTTAGEVLRGDGSVIDPTSDWQGADGWFWDSAVTPASAEEAGLGPGDEAYRITYEPMETIPALTPDFVDCVTVVSHVLGVR